MSDWLKMAARSHRMHPIKRGHFSATEPEQPRLCLIRCMECKRFRTEVEDYLATSLDREEQAAFETHRGECSDCRVYLQDILRLAALLRVNDSVRAPSNLWSKIEARLGNTPVVTPIVRMMRVVSAAAALALVTLGVLAMQPGRSAKDLDRIQTSEISWVSGEENDELVDPIANMLLSPKEK